MTDALTVNDPNAKVKRCELTWLVKYSCAHCLGHEPDFEIGRDGVAIG